MSAPALTRRILFSAGDVSGDLHGAALVRTLRKRRDDLTFSGLGGRAMADAGVDLVAPSDALAIGGLVEVLRALGTVRRVRRAILDHVRAAPPDLVVLIDSGGFNLPLARSIRKLCDAPILYYVAPQVWAWRRGRIRKIAARIDRLAVILPFEAEHYAGTSVPVDFVGHPLVDELAADAAPGVEGGLPAESDSHAGDSGVATRRAARSRLGLDPTAVLLALAPGSRRNEVDAHLPTQLATLACMRAERPGLRGVVALAASIDRAQVDHIIDASGQRGGLDIVEGGSRDVLRAADVGLLKPGTVTTEAMLLGLPMVMIARAHPISATLIRRLVRVPHLAMPNLVAGRRIVPEYWQQEARPEILARDLGALLEGPARRTQLDALREAARMLGPGGASARAADVVSSMLDASNPGSL